VEESIAGGIERERQPARPGVVTRFNQPPGIAPFYFQNRHVETGLVGHFLKADARLITVVARRRRQDSHGHGFERLNAPTARRRRWASGERDRLSQRHRLRE
jgi:hypothetical protein